MLRNTDLRKDRIIMDRVKVETGDVFDYTADVLVFPANKMPRIGGSLDGQVYEKAEKVSIDILLEERMKHGELHSGEVCLTQSHGLEDHFKYLIHAASPVYQHHHKKGSAHKLKKCYLEALRLAEENQLKTIVFALLGAGASGFPFKMAVKEATTAIENYFSEHKDSRIESVTLVKYTKESEYQNLLKINKKLKEVNLLLSEVEGFETYIKKDSEIGKILGDVEAKLRKAVLENTDNLYIQYQEEMKKYCEEKQVEQEEYNYKLYKEIVDLSKAFTNEQLADIIDEKDFSIISKIKNLKKNDPQKSQKALAFLKKRLNVLKFGLGIKLSVDNLCRLMWCRGHSFPSDQIDFDILTMYLPDNNYDTALKAVLKEIEQDKTDKAERKEQQEKKKEEQNQKNKNKEIER